MKLRQKFGVLALIYVLSLSANLIMSGWCIVVYFQSAFVDVQSSFVRQTEIERLRLQIQVAKARFDMLPLQSDAVVLEPTLKQMREQVSARLEGFNKTENISDEQRLWNELHQVAHANASTSPAEVLKNCDVILGQISALITISRHDAINHAATTQQHVVAILIINACVGAMLCLVGLILVRRWVLLPVEKLRTAAHEIAAGNFDHRIRPQSADELGTLSTEVNHMSEKIVGMQARLVEQERQAAAGEMFRRIAHNIRNPLAGIRGLAEATRAQHSDSDDSTEYQERIIKAIDRLEQWLRELQHSVEPMNIAPQRTDLTELIENVRNVLTPMADRIGVRLVAMIDPTTRYVIVDGFHFEQALVALITNAIQASKPNQTVKIRATPAEGHPDQWSVRVEDEGSGIAADLQSRIFLPNYTTRPEGNGLGLSMVAKVVRTHGGRVHCESSPGRGARFEAIMPGRVVEES